MKSQNSVKNIDQASERNEYPSLSKESHEQDFVTHGLIYMLERLTAYFQQHTPLDDRETLVFCLHHLFHHVDELYCETLPTLAQVTHTAVDALAVFPSDSKSQIGVRYALWTRLQEMQQHVERVESLCHLLNRTVPRLLGVLDTPDTADISNEYQNTQDRHHPSNLMSQEEAAQWQEAYEWLTARLNIWQERNGERLSFKSVATSPPMPDTSTHASSSPIPPLLSKIDAALMLMLDSAGAIFGDIVPDFQAVAQGNDEMVATLLFDLMQQADLLLLQCDALFGPLQDLIRHYMLSE